MEHYARTTTGELIGPYEVIHCNDPVGLKTARDYLKEVSA
jgi:hypothetical protein